MPLADVGRVLGHKTLAMVLRSSHDSPANAGSRARDALEAFLAKDAAEAAAK